VAVADQVAGTVESGRVKFDLLTFKDLVHRAFPVHRRMSRVLPASPLFSLWCSRAAGQRAEQGNKHSQYGDAAERGW
jgi:hypothetical protein